MRAYRICRAHRAGVLNRFGRWGMGQWGHETFVGQIANLAADC